MNQNKELKEQASELINSLRYNQKVNNCEALLLDEDVDLLVMALEAWNTRPGIPTEEEMYKEMERRFEIPFDQDGYMQIDDTQIGWEECFKWALSQLPQQISEEEINKFAKALAVHGKSAQYSPLQHIGFLKGAKWALSYTQEKQGDISDKDY